MRETRDGWAGNMESFEIASEMTEALARMVRTQSIGDFVFFRLILDFLRDQVAEFGITMLGRTIKWVTGIALTLMTLWVMVQGYRIVTGRSRDSMMVLVTNTARAALIVSVAATMSLFGRNVHDFLTEDLNGLIAVVVTGKDKKPEKQIDESLAWMQVALSSIDALQVHDDAALQQDKSRAQWFIGVGTGGPAITAGAMLLLYQVAMAMFIGLGPIFILCLLFDQTRPLFQRWLLYGIGTMFSMAVLAVMVSIALDMVVRVSEAFWVSALASTYLLQDPGSVNGMTSQAMQQGGMGLILSTLILTAPPMAAMFFQGTLGTFAAYPQIGGNAAGYPGPGGQPPGMHAGSAVMASRATPEPPPAPAIGTQARVMPQAEAAPTTPGQRGLGNT